MTLNVLWIGITIPVCYLYWSGRYFWVTAMKSVRSKKELHEDLDKEVQAFLEHGGHISVVEQGKSGLPHEKPWINPFKAHESEQAQSRTPIPEVVAAIDARKHAKKKPTSKSRKPKKEWILDDFGEPVRWVWKE